MLATILGILMPSLTAGFLFAGYFRLPRRRRFPLYGWLGILSLSGAVFLILLHAGPVEDYFAPLAWSSYILVVDAAVLSLSGRSRLYSAPFPFARLAALSVPLYFIFEIFHLRMRNWTCTGNPRVWPSRVLVCIWLLSTVFPALFETSDLVQAVLPPLPGRPFKIPAFVEYFLMSSGALSLILLLILPTRVASFFFGSVWIGFLFLLDPINHRLGLPSILGDLSEGFRRRAYGFSLAGWIYGSLWEIWNLGVATKGAYSAPILHSAGIFEMPAPGLLWFVPFSLECFVLYVTASWLTGWLKRVR
jgi:hypothetical protein